MVKRGGEWPSWELASVVREFGMHPEDFTPVRSAWRVDTPEGPRFLKCTTLTPPEIIFLWEALSHLERRGEPVPRLAQDSLGRPWVARPPYAFLLTDWVTGREARFSDPSDLERAAQAVARLHRRGEGFVPSSAARARVEWGRWPERFGRRARQLEEFRAAASVSKDDFDREYLAIWPFYAAQARKALKLLAGSAYPRLSAARLRRPVICHHDLCQQNFLITGERGTRGGGGVRLIDFDYCIHDLAPHDLANFVWRRVQGEGSPAPARTVLRAYTRLRPLSRAELRLLWALLVWPHRFWLIGWQRYVEQLPWPEERWRDAVARQAQDAGVREGLLAALADDLETRRW